MLLITVATSASPFSRPCDFMCRAHMSMHRVAVDDPSLVIDEDRAVAVAVERHAHAVAAVADERAQALGMSRAAIEVDVAAVRLVADDGDVEPQLAEQPRRHRRRRAVGRVDGDLERRGRGSRY